MLREIKKGELIMFNSNHTFPTMPHAHPVPPPHKDPVGRHNIISVLYDGEILQKVFGDFWAFHIEKIAFEPPEMKMLFALEMGFNVSANEQVVELLARQRKKERERGTSHKFENAALNDEILQAIAERLGIDKDTVSLVLEHAPDGVVSVIIATVKNN